MKIIALYLRKQIEEEKALGLYTLWAYIETSNAKKKTKIKFQIPYFTGCEKIGRKIIGFHITGELVKEPIFTCFSGYPRYVYQGTIYHAEVKTDRGVILKGNIRTIYGGYFLDVESKEFVLAQLEYPASVSEGNGKKSLVEDTYKTQKSKRDFYWNYDIMRSSF